MLNAVLADLCNNSPVQVQLMSINIEKLQPSILFSDRNSEMVRFTKTNTKKNIVIGTGLTNNKNSRTEKGISEDRDVVIG